MGRLVFRSFLASAVYGSVLVQSLARDVAANKNDAADISASADIKTATRHATSEQDEKSGESASPPSYRAEEVQELLEQEPVAGKGKEGENSQKPSAFAQNLNNVGADDVRPMNGTSSFLDGTSNQPTLPRTSIWDDELELARFEGSFLTYVGTTISMEQQMLLTVSSEDLQKLKARPTSFSFDEEEDTSSTYL